MGLGRVQALRIFLGDQNLDALARQKASAQKANGSAADDEDGGLDLIHGVAQADLDGSLGVIVRPKLEGILGPHWLTAPTSIEWSPAGMEASN